MSEALIFASINPQYDNRLFMKLPWKLQAQNMGKTITCSAHVLLVFYTCSLHGNSMNNILSYCGWVDARISASEKDLSVCINISSVVAFKRWVNGKNWKKILRWMTVRQNVPKFTCKVDFRCLKSQDFFFDFLFH